MNRLINLPRDCHHSSETAFKARNSLAGHPLFEEQRIKLSLRRLPRHEIEIRTVQSQSPNYRGYSRGEVLPDADPLRTFEQLGETPRWMLCHHLWTYDPEYRELMQQFAKDLIETFPGMGDYSDLSDLGCWLFLSSGKIIVHFHADPDQSFLNQIRGSKTVYVYPANILPEPSVENLVYLYDQNAVTYHPEYEQTRFPPIKLDPGESTYLPLYAPHEVVNDDTVCISLNIGFHTRRSRRRRAVHLLNFEMRGLGLQPAPYGRYPIVDSVKMRMPAAFRAKNRLLKSLKSLYL
jgi:hypothetical protein